MNYRSAVLALLLLCVSAPAVLAQGRPDRPRPATGVNEVNVRPSGLTVDMRPDLVVRDIRREGPNAFRVLVANQGMRDASTFGLLLRLNFAEPDPIPGMSRGRAVVDVAGVRSNEEVWVSVTTSASDDKLATIRSVEASADPGYQRWSTGSTWPAEAAGPVWVSPRVPERDEMNNSLTIAIADLRAWP